MFDANLKAIKSAYDLTDFQYNTLYQLLRANIPEIDGLRCTVIKPSESSVATGESKDDKDMGPIFSKVVDGRRVSCKALFADNEVRFYCYAVKEDMGASDPDKPYAVKRQDPLFNRFCFTANESGSSMSFSNRKNVVKVIKGTAAEDYIVQIFTGGSRFKDIQAPSEPDDVFKVHLEDMGDSSVIFDGSRAEIGRIVKPMGKSDNFIKLMWLVGTKVNGEYIDRQQEQLLTQSERRRGR